jgi:hypothetical protein
MEVQYHCATMPVFGTYSCNVSTSVFCDMCMYGLACLHVYTHTAAFQVQWEPYVIIHTYIHTYTTCRLAATFQEQWEPHCDHTCMHEYIHTYTSCRSAAAFQEQWEPHCDPIVVSCEICTCASVPYVDNIVYVHTYGNVIIS